MESLFQMLFSIQGKLDHSLKEFVCLQSGKIVTNQFLAEQATNIAKLATLLLSGVHKVSVPVVDDNHVLVNIES